MTSSRIKRTVYAKYYWFVLGKSFCVDIVIQILFMHFSFKYIKVCLALFIWIIFALVFFQKLYGYLCIIWTRKVHPANSIFSLNYSCMVNTVILWLTKIICSEISHSLAEVYVYWNVIAYLIKIQCQCTHPMKYSFAESD